MRALALAVIFPSVLAGGTATPLRVIVSVEPQAYFVERIGSGRVTTGVLVKPGKDPHTYAPTPGQVSDLAKARVFFRIGVPFEEVLLPKMADVARDMEVVDTRKGIPLRSMGGGHHHGHGGEDPHVWLNPLLAKQQARTMRDTLVRLDPGGKETYGANFDSLAAELDALDRKLARILAPIKGGTIYVFHPSFGYLTDAYGLKQMAVEMEGKPPKGKELTRLIKQAKQDGVRVIFVQPRFDQNAARTIAKAIDGVVVPLDPLARDYVRNLEDMAGKILAALKG